MDLADKIVIVTGAGHGIGRALAIGFARDGAHVVGFGRTGSALEETASLCEAGRMSHLVGDISSEADVRRLVEETTRDRGRVDVLVNNAAVYPRGRFLEQPFSEWARTIEINVIGTALCCRHVLPGMLERGSGRIVNVGSFAGLAPAPGSSAYSVSKAALMSLTKAIAAEVDPGRYPDVLINELAPPPAATRMNPGGHDDPASVYPHVRFLVDLPAGGPTGRLFANNRIHQTDFGIKARIRRGLVRARSRLTGEPAY